MSWQAYVDTNLVGTKKVSKAAILGQKGGSWAASSGYNLSVQEQKDIVSLFDNPDQAFATGVRLSGEKFIAFKADSRSIYSRKLNDGAVIVKTKQAVIVAEYIAPIQAGECTPVVEGLADYLINLGY